MTNTILITGGAGYIGSHVAHAATDAGHRVLVLDDLSTGRAESVPPSAHFVKGDVRDPRLLRSLLRDYEVTAAMHLAGRVVVPESVERPIKYYQENTVATLGVIAALLEARVRAMVFSSTAAVYEPPADGAKVTETSPTAPLTPYGHSKLMSEQMLADAGRAYDFRAGVLRYFNVAGADTKGRTGQSTPDATHLIKVAAEVAVGSRAELEIFGTDYDTPDGTCVRDYIHVSDLAEAHLLVLEHLLGGGGSLTLNCGYGQGHSVREVVSAVERVTGRRLPTKIARRRAGDPPLLVADNSRIRKTLDWTPTHDNLDEIVESAIGWEEALRGKAA